MNDINDVPSSLNKCLGIVHDHELNSITKVTLTEFNKNQLISVIQSV
jgi:hypothetical protein